jgi:hypothetical protein
MSSSVLVSTLAAGGVEIVIPSDVCDWSVPNGIIQLDTFRKLAKRDFLFPGERLIFYALVHHSHPLFKRAAAYVQQNSPQSDNHSLVPESVLSRFREFRSKLKFEVRLNYHTGSLVGTLDDSKDVDDFSEDEEDDGLDVFDESRIEGKEGVQFERSFRGDDTLRTSSNGSKIKRKSSFGKRRFKGSSNPLGTDRLAVGSVSKFSDLIVVQKDSKNSASGTAEYIQKCVESLAMKFELDAIGFQENFCAHYFKIEDQLAKLSVVITCPDIYSPASIAEASFIGDVTAIGIAKPTQHVLRSFIAKNHFISSAPDQFFLSKVTQIKRPFTLQASVAMCDDKRCFSVRLQHDHPEGNDIEILGVEVRVPVDSGFFPTHQFELPETLRSGEVQSFLITFLPNPGKEYVDHALHNSNSLSTDDVPFTITWKSKECFDAIQVHQILNWRQGQDDSINLKLSCIVFHQDFLYLVDFFC